MTRPAGDRRNRDVVADALCEQQPAFEAFVRARVRPQDVDDLLQLAALRAIERADSLEDPERVVAWLYRIHRNLIVDVARTRSSERRYVDAVAQLPERADPPVADPCECSVTQARRLRPAYATILSLVDSDGLQLREAARQLEVSPNNAAVRLHRARRALKRAMLEHCGVDDPRQCADCRCVEDACCAA